MCEKRTRKITKSSQAKRLHETRRLQRLQWITSPTYESTATPTPDSLQADKAARNRVLLDLAWRTITLMHRNRVIQERILALQQETSQFLAAVMKNPETKYRYVEHLRLTGLIPEPEIKQNETNTDEPLKVETND